ncbi:MAG: terminase family protein, partial [Pseudomonadota bacterium]
MADGPALRRALLRLQGGLQRLAEHRAGRRLAGYRPYPQQAAFHAAGAEAPERLFMAANQVGKTFAGACEVAIHATGDYPDWWRGRRFDRPNRWWVGGVTAEATRDNPQRLLVGPAHAADEGVLPDARILRRIPTR